MKKKYILIIIVVAILLIFSAMFIYINEKNKNTHTDEIKLDINKVDASFGMDRAKMDADIREVYGVFMSQYKFLDDLKIPSDLNIKSTMAILINHEVKKYKNEDFNKKYDTLNNYTTIYHNEIDSRNIELKFSDKYVPLRDYFFEGTPKKSIINNTQLEIFQYENMYLAMFKYNDINFDIETTDITESELIELLKSIIK